MKIKIDIDIPGAFDFTIAKLVKSKEGQKGGSYWQCQQQCKYSSLHSDTTYKRFKLYFKWFLSLLRHVEFRMNRQLHMKQSWVFSPWIVKSCTLTEKTPKSYGFIFVSSLDFSKYFIVLVFWTLKALVIYVAKYKIINHKIGKNKHGFCCWYSCCRCKRASKTNV